ncbi:hypothetical protein LTSEADE_1750, partial [Salmonella enterica subsp. enterica serovar Adelaide str. A4-669]
SRGNVYFVGVAYGILRRLNICYRTFSLKHNEENK